MLQLKQSAVQVLTGTMQCCLLCSACVVFGNVVLFAYLLDCWIDMTIVGGTNNEILFNHLKRVS